MPWKETCVYSQRVEFILEWKRSRTTLSALCRAFGVSRTTAYKWIERFQTEGEEQFLDVLEDRSRRPCRTPHKVAPEVEDLIIQARKRWPSWGPRKLRSWLLAQGGL